MNELEKVLFNNLVAPIFQEVRIFANGPVAYASYAIASAILLYEGMIGAAELIAEKETCRFFNVKWLFRVVFVGALLVFSEKIFVDVPETLCREQLGTFVSEWASMLIRCGKALTDFIGSAVQLLTTDGGDGGVGAVLNAIKPAMLLKIILWGGAMVLGGCFTVIALAVMFGFALLGCGSVALICAVAPIYIAFGLSESTQSMAMQYFKVWFGNALLYMPFLILSMKICSRCMMGNTFVGMATADKSGWINLFGMIFSMTYGPILGVFTLLIGPRTIKSLTSAH